MLAIENLGRCRKQLEQLEGREREAVERLERYKRCMRDMGGGGGRTEGGEEGLWWGGVCSILPWRTGQRVL